MDVKLKKKIFSYNHLKKKISELKFFFSHMFIQKVKSISKARKNQKNINWAIDGKRLD